MMKKRIFILTLILFFFTSTTGLPIVLHYCEMMESVSLEVCKIHKQENIKTFCCEKEKDEIRLTNGYDTCCSVKLVNPSVKDDFVILKTEVTKQTLITFILPDFTANINNVNNTIFFNDTSPPLNKGNSVFLLNSSFLI